MTTKEIIDLPTKAWIILITWPTTHDWYGSFPCEPYQWFATESRETTIPKYFHSKEDAEKHAKDYGFGDFCKIVQVAGEGWDKPEHINQQVKAIDLIRFAEEYNGKKIQCHHEWNTLLSGEYKCMKCGAKE